jgi:UDP-N-acetylglucosamine 2-epimerase (hydrolysing)
MTKSAHMPDTCKRILFLTSTRADFGKMKPLIRKAEQDDGLENHVFVTGMHLLSRYGYTLIEVEKEGFSNIFTYINQLDATHAQMDLVLANTIQGLGYYIREFPPDMVVIHGDRVEALAGAIVGALNNVLVAHVEGGELSGTIDELMRHAISKLSHLHFVANEEAKRRLIQMGEVESSIFVIGSPDIDIMLSDELPSIAEVRQRYDIPFEQYSIVLYHPVTTELDAFGERAKAVATALQMTERNYVVIYPNNDPGSELILNAFLPLGENPRFRVLPSMRFEYFLTLLKCSDAIVGNSSAGVREAPVYGVPTVNIGSRQMNRFHWNSIVSVPPTVEAVVSALNNLPKDIASSFHFGNGNSAEQFLHALNDPVLWATSRQKQFQETLITLPTGLDVPDLSGNWEKTTR